MEIKNIDIENLSTKNLAELENLREIIDDRIEVFKGEESLKNHSTYSSDEVEIYLKECLKK